MDHEAPEWPRSDLGSFELRAPDRILRFFRKILKFSNLVNFNINHYCVSQHIKISATYLFRKMRYGHLSVECLFLKKLFFSQKSSFSIKCQGKIPNKVCSKLFFLVENYETHPTSYNFRILDINFSQSLKKH
jgi:hypothetical protein